MLLAKNLQFHTTWWAATQVNAYIPKGLWAKAFKLSEPESFLMNHDSESTTTGAANATL